MRRIIRHRRLSLLMLGLASALLLTSIGLLTADPTVHAQSTCEEPFADAGPLRFSTHFWQKTDFCKHSVPYSEIRSGGPPPDGIPPIDNPKFESISEASGWLHSQSPVVVVDIEGDARAYPLAILTWHEIANDVVGGVPVAVTFCPLCNSSIVFDRRVGEETLRFGVSGNLRNSDLVMWDDKTQSWWQQLTGEGIVGTYTDVQLKFLPSYVVGFAEFAKEFPEGKVLSRDTGHLRSYGRNPYTSYDTSSRPFLFEGEIDNRLFPTEHVLAGIIGGQPIAYPYSLLASERVVNHEVGGVKVVVFWQPGSVSALDKTVIDDSRDVGMAALYNRELEEQVLTFRVDAEGLITDEQTGSTWNVFGRAVAGELKDKQLRQEIAGPHFWFAWAAFRPDTALYGASE